MSLLRINETELSKKLFAPYVIPHGLSRLHESRIDALDLRQIYQVIYEWIKNRPLLAWSDGRVDVVKRLIMCEVEEFLEEYPADDATPEQRISALKEIVDIIFFEIGMQVSHNLEPDYDEIYHRLNGQGERSGVYHQMIQIAGNMEPSTMINDVKVLMILWAAVYTRPNIRHDAQDILHEVILKNTGNYPIEYMQIEKNMSPEELSDAFEHRVRCLRLIRYVNKLRKLDRPYGLQPEDHQDYKKDILDHLHSDISWLRIAESLASRYNLDINEVMASENQKHTTVAGLNLADQPQIISRPLPPSPTDLSLPRTEILRLPVAQTQKIAV